MTELYPHQVRAVNKLKKLKVGALFMEQGTGKTRTALELIKIRMDAGKVSKVLWLCPCSVKENLKADIIKHIGHFPDYIKITGIQTLSSSVRENAECLEYVSPDCYLVVDESLLIKNHHAIRSDNIVRLSERCTYKLILNGTPISRTQADLYNQFKILDWRILGYKSFYSFAANHLEYDEYGKIRRCLNTDYLAKKVDMYSVEIKKSDCLQLPNKRYYEYGYNMTDEQDWEYSKVAEDLLFEVDEMKPETIYRLFSGLQAVISGMRINSKGRFIPEPMFTGFENPRLRELDDVLAVTGDEKVMIFCKYTHEIDTLCEYLGDKAVRYDGSISVKKRNAAVEKFRSDSQYLIANKTCAGFGLNLQFCHNIVFYSNDWDFATRSQAEDRIHRIGQEEECRIFDIYAKHSLEQRILKCLARKENILESFKDNLKKLEWLRGEDDEEKLRKQDIH